MRLGASCWVKSTARVAIRTGSPTALSRAASLFGSLPAPTTAMPIRASWVTQPKPMPLLALVTMATCMSLSPSIGCDSACGRFQTTGDGDQQLRTLQEQMRIGFVTETHATVDLNTQLRVFERGGAGHRKRVLDLHGRIGTTLVQRNRCKARLITRAARSDGHVGAVVFYRLKRADGPAKL